MGSILALIYLALIYLAWSCTNLSCCVCCVIVPEYYTSPRIRMGNCPGYDLIHWPSWPFTVQNEKKQSNMGGWGRPHVIRHGRMGPCFRGAQSYCCCRWTPGYYVATAHFLGPTAEVYRPQLLWPHVRRSPLPEHNSRKNIKTKI
jgi:hypothetical protein